MIKQAVQAIILFVLCALPSLGYGSNLQERLFSIPKKDREALESFFSSMISYEYFGYVLFGDKPMAAGGFEHALHPREYFKRRGSKAAQASFRVANMGEVSFIISQQKFYSTLIQKPLLKAIQIY